ncbi:hypothetical protein D3C77_694130 [compost metagenome]
MAAHHQVAALDLADVHLGGQAATDQRAQLLEPGTVAVLAGQFRVVVVDVLCGQAEQGE